MSSMTYSTSVCPMRVAMPPIPGSRAPTAMKMFPVYRCRSAGWERNRHAESAAPPMRNTAA